MENDFKFCYNGLIININRDLSEKRMSKKIISALLAILITAVAIPFSASAENGGLSLVFSPDKSLENTVCVSVAVEGNFSVSEDGVFAYFTYDSGALELCDKSGNKIDFENFKKGVTFSENGVQGVECTQGWRDESSFVKKSNSGNLVGIEVFPDAQISAENGITTAFVRLKIKNGSFADFNPSWVLPLREKADNAAFSSAVYTSSGKSEQVPFAYYSNELKQFYCEHSWGELVRENPESGRDGKAYYVCSKCSLKTGVLSADGELSPQGRSTSFLKDLSENNYSVIPSAQANNFDYKGSDGASIYNYSLRGAAIRCFDSPEGKSDMRFASSMAVPTLFESASAVEKSVLKIKDFGVVFCPSESIEKSGKTASDDTSALDVQKLVKDGVTGNIGENVYGIKCAVSSFKNSADAGSSFNFSTYDKNGKYTGSSLYSSQNTDSAKYFTFNLVIRVDEYNYKRFYAVRPFITYEYFGEEYTIYDCDDALNPVCSSRSVYLVAQKAYESPDEPSVNKEFLDSTILSLYK